MSPRTRTPLRIRRRRGRRPAAVVAAGLITVALIAAFVWLSENSYNGLPFINYRTVYVTLPNIGHLQQHDPVEIAGVRVGQVLNAVTKNNRALIELQLQGVGPLPIDSSVVVRADGLLGERYLELTPGRSHTVLPNGATINAGANSFTNGIPETLNLFDPKTRTALGEMVNGLGEGVLGRGEQLNQAIHVGPPSGADFDTTANAILARPGAASRFLPDTASGIDALDSARDDIAEMLRPAADGLAPLTTERGATDDALSLAPSTLQSIDKGLAEPATELLASLRKVAGAADEVLPAAPEGLRSATALLRGAPGPLRSTKLVFDAVPSAVPAALSILSSLRPNLVPLRGAFTNLVSPVTNLSERGCDLQNMFTGARSLVNFGTLPGGGFGPDNGFPLSAVVAPAEAGYVTKIGTYPTENPYPAPCSYAPGPTVDQASLTSVLTQTFP